MTVREPNAYDLDREEADLDRADHHQMIADMQHERQPLPPDEFCPLHGGYAPQSLLDGDCPHCRHDDHDQPGQTGHWDWPAHPDK